MTNAIREILDYDSLAHAESLLGPNEEAAQLGLAMHIIATQHKREVLEMRGDTTFSNDLDRYLTICKEEGFEIVLKLPFMGQKSWDQEAPQETFYVLFHKELGILLKFDTYNTNRVNGGAFLYNWSPNSDEYEDYSSAVSSGGPWIKGTPSSGDHDCREALRFNLAELKRCGQFHTPWVKQPFLWLLHYMDTKEEAYDYKAIVSSRIAMLPQYVQDAIKGNE